MIETYLYTPESAQCVETECDPKTDEECFDDFRECYMDNNLGYKNINGECVYTTNCDHYNEYCYINLNECEDDTQLNWVLKNKQCITSNCELENEDCYTLEKCLDLLEYKLSWKEIIFIIMLLIICFIFVLYIISSIYGKKFL